MNLTGPLRSVGRITIQQMLKRRLSRAGLVKLMAKGHAHDLPHSIRQPLLLHISDYSRQHPEFLEEVKVSFGARTNDEFQAAFWGSDFGWMLEDSDVMFSAKYQYFRDATREFTGTRYLDVGCGWGALCIWVKKTHPNADVFGLDLTPRVLNIARQRASHAGVDITFVNASALELLDHFPPGSIDVITCTDAFYYIEDGLGALDVMSRAARECVFVTSPMGGLTEEDYVRATEPVKRWDYDVSWNHPLVEYADKLKLPVHSRGRISANCYYLDIRFPR